MKKTALITGGTGLLGFNWGRLIRNHYDTILGLNSRDNKLCGVGKVHLKLDNVEDLVSQLSTLKVDIIIHTAALTNVEYCEKEPELAHYINVRLASNLATACEYLGIKLVQISTDHLFGGQKAFYTEVCPVFPLNVYAETKYKAEKAIMSLNSKSLIIRTNFYGWGTYYRKSFSDTIIQSLGANKEVFIFQDVFFTPILIDSLVEVVHQLIQLDVNGIFNVVGEERISKYHFAVCIAERFELDARKLVPCSISDRLDLVRRPKDMSLDNQKVCNTLGRKIGSFKADISKLYDNRVG